MAYLDYIRCGGFITAGIACTYSFAAHSLPHAGQIVAGNATITHDATTTQINQRSDRAVIE